MLSIDPETITLIHHLVLQDFSIAVQTILKYANHLFYLFLTMEIILLGLLYAMGSPISPSETFLTILKIGLLFFILQNYTYLLGTVFDGFITLANEAIKQHHQDHPITRYINNPSLLWHYSYDTGVSLLKAATQTQATGLVLLYFFLGMGILLTFTFLIMQVLFQYIGFYVVSFTALIMIPIGVLKQSVDFFNQAVRRILQSGIRLMIIMIIIAVAVTVWEQLGLGRSIIDIKTLNLNMILGLFFSALVFLGLSIYLPGIAAQTVGNIFPREIKSNPHQIATSSTMGVNQTSTTLQTPPVVNIQTATQLTSTLSTSLPAMPHVDVHPTMQTSATTTGSQQQHHTTQNDTFKNSENPLKLQIDSPLSKKLILQNEKNSKDLKTLTKEIRKALNEINKHVAPKNQ